jgi:hypothetical protein
MFVKIKLLVATHKQYDFPQNDIYIPINVGNVLHPHNFGYLTDDDGINISVKNKSFSELTALYWAWKNEYFANSDICGLVHYRRYFLGSESFNKLTILGYEDIKTIFMKHDVIVAVKRNYYIETIRSHYGHAHYAKDLVILENIISQYTPEYLKVFNEVMDSKKLSLYNMFVMKTEYFDSYCIWLFNILFKVEQKIDISEYDNYQKRVFGFLAERLFNVWILHNGLNIKEVKVQNIEGENLIFKAINMMKRKYKR